MPNDLFFRPSSQQIALFAFAQSGQGNAALEACAGSGKSSTLVKAAPLLRGSTWFGAFNKAAAKELDGKLKADGVCGVKVSTLHAAGLAIWHDGHSKVVVEPRKLNKLVRQIAGEQPGRAWQPYYDYACEMVHFAMAAGVGLTDPRELRNDKRWKEVEDHFDVDRALPSAMEVGADNLTRQRIGLQLAQALMLRSLEACPEMITYDEMLYAPLHFGCRMQSFDNVLLDEAQDSNVPRIELTERMMSARGRLLAVGDRHQSIYGFTGADSDAMPNIIARFNCKVLPLSVSFRCPQAIVDYAQQFVGAHIHAAPGAPEGRIRRAVGWDWLGAEQFRPDDVILCRYNAPLVAHAYDFMRNGTPFRLAGRNDIGGRLRKLVMQWGTVRSLDGVEEGLCEWLAEEEQIARQKDKPGRAETARDLVMTLREIMNRSRQGGGDSVAAVVAEIDRLFVRPGKPALTLSSIHKAKGLEWQRVFWLLHQSSRDPQKEWQQQQENNLRYVATTRAQHELVLVDLQQWRS